MTATETYATLAQVRNDLNIDADTDDRAAAVEPALNAAHDAVDRHCHRTFGKLDTAEAREFVVPYASELLTVPDMAEAPTQVVMRVEFSHPWDDEGLTWTTRPTPPGQPYAALIRIGGPWPAALFPTVAVTAKWGWPSVPASVTQATRLLAVRYISRFKKPLLADGPDGQLLRVDPDVRWLLRPFVRAWDA
ncbi:hypothetical protein [Candidatus Poriferisodalis sp.]|uniref:hypothetical protein n=1 Tax=Candidatus Poriferisodalis sp. TaxID=3101277 RepID=UPI003B02B5EE